MRFTLLFALALFTFLPPAYAVKKGTPFPPAIDTRFHELETGEGLDDSAIVTAKLADSAVTTAKVADEAITSAKVPAMSDDGITFGHWARATFSAIGGAVTVGAHPLGVSLPAKAVITRSFIRVNTQFADTGTCTVALHCEDANNIKTATDISGSASGAFIEGESTGASTAFKSSIGSACEITMTIADGGSCVPSDGNGTVWVQYFVHD